LKTAIDGVRMRAMLLGRYQCGPALPFVQERIVSFTLLLRIYNKLPQRSGSGSRRHDQLFTVTSEHIRLLTF